VLWEQGHLARTAPARFHTKSGLLTCEAKGAWIEMDFPAKREAPAVPPPELGPALGASMKYVGRNAFDYLVEVDAETTVRELRPDHARLRRLPVRGLMVTALSASPAYDFISRFFAPGSGIDEDPVTGSAHCALGPFLERAPRPAGAHRLPGLGARRGGEGESGRRSRGAGPARR